MTARAVAKYVRVSPRRARQVIDLIRGKSVDEALAILRFMPKKASAPVAKVVRSAAANAEHNNNLGRDNLVIATAFVDQGPTMKRYRARAYGRANVIHKRMSHITVVVREKEIERERKKER